MTTPLTKKNQGSYPDIVYTLEPLLQFSIYLLQILRWKDGRQSFLIVLLWTLLCHHHHLILLTTPLWLILFFHHDTNKKKQQLQTTALAYERVTNELREIQIELDVILPPIQHSIDWFRRGTSRTLMVVGWMTFVLLFHHCVWFLGLLALSWKSPLFKLARHACHRVMLIYYSYRTPIQNEVRPLHAPIDSSDRFYCFTVIENQRWYPLSGWSALLLQTDRPNWSDIYHHKVPSIDLFELPPAITRTGQDGKETKISWSWTMDHWQENDWEYGNWDWKSWGTRNSIGQLTRRRHWVRTALLTQEEEVTRKPIPIPMSRSNSLTTMTSSSSSSSVASSLSSIDLMPSLSLQPQTKSYHTTSIMSEMDFSPVFSSVGLSFTQ